MSSLRIAIIGCGKQAPKHISGFKKLAQLEITLADIEPGRAEELAAKEGVGWVESIDEIFTDPAIRAVDICVPTPAHSGLALRAIAAGKDFFCEKPLCESAAQARAIAERLSSGNVIGMVGYIYRFAPVFEYAHNLFKDTSVSGKSLELGRVAGAIFRLGGRGGHQVWKHRQDSGGGAISEMLVHMLDLALWYFGPVEQVLSVTKTLLRPRRYFQDQLVDVDAEDYVVVSYRSRSNVMVTCQADLITPAFSQYTEIQGENGTFMGSIQTHMPSFIYLDQQAAGRPPGRTGLEFPAGNLFENQMAEFVHLVRTRQKPWRCTVEESIHLLEFMEEIRGVIQ